MFRIKVKRARLKLFSIVYIGDKYSCNICNKSAGKFITHGHVPRMNARCPHCLSLERTRVLWFYLNNEGLLQKEDLKVLHFAPEPEIEEKIREKENVTYLTADINPNIADYVVDIQSIPFEDDSFDLIICSHVLVEVPDEIKALEELKRVIRKNGNILIITKIFDNQKTDDSPASLTEKQRYDKYGANLCRTHGDDFTSILESVGLSVEVIDYRKTLGDKMILKYSLGDGDKETIFKCTKAGA